MWQNKKKPLAVGLAVLLLALLLSACGGGATVAEYEGGTVTEAEFDGFLGANKFFNYNEMYSFYEMMPDFKESMLHQYIATKLLVSEVNKDAVKSADKRAKDDLKSMLASIKADQESRKSYQQFLDEHSMEEKHLEQYVANQYKLEELFAGKFTDEEVRAKYDEQIAADKNAYITTATVRHILVSTSDPNTQEDIRTLEEAHERALEVYQKLKDGGDWGELAKEYSDDPGSKENGGQYANENVDRWDPAFRQASIEQPLGEIGEPFESSFGYHVMVVEERNSNDFESVKNAVRGQMANAVYTEYIEKVPDLITVVNLPEPEEEVPGEETPEDGASEGEAPEGEAGEGEDGQDKAQ